MISRRRILLGLGSLFSLAGFASFFVERGLFDGIGQIVARLSFDPNILKLAREDYQTGRTRKIDGWVVSKTEYDLWFSPADDTVSRAE